MYRFSLLVLVSPLILSSAVYAQSDLKLGEPAGAVDLVSPEGLRISMNNYSERRGTAVLFLSARDDGTTAESDAIVTLNQKFRHHRILVTAIFPDPAETGAEVRSFCQAHGFNFAVYLDPGRKAAKTFGARVTPEAFLLDKEGKLTYSGSIHGLAAALAAFDSGSPLPASEDSVSGTPIGDALPKRAMEDPYGEIDFSSELIFDKIPGYPVHH